MDTRNKWLIALLLLFLGLLAWRGCTVHIAINDRQGKPSYPQIAVVLLTPTSATPLKTPIWTDTPYPSPDVPTPTQTNAATSTQSPTPVAPTQTAVPTATSSPTRDATPLSAVIDPLRVSVASDGTQANGPSVSPRQSADGRFIVFASDASNLVPNDTNNARDAFVHDLQTSTTMRVSVASDGKEGNGNSGYIGDRASIAPAISADGRYVAFESQASNLVPDDTNRSVDIFVHDLHTGTTTRVSVASDGSQVNGRSFNPALSADGRFITFESTAATLVPEDDNAVSDVFVHDQEMGETTLVSMSTAGVPGNKGSEWPTISADGRFVAFHSFADNLVPDDTNDSSDVFVHNRQTGETVRVSIASDGSQAVGGVSQEAMISGNGRYVAFGSYATNLVANDRNNTQDVFVHDRETGLTHHISIATDGTQAGDMANVPSISSDGRYIAFQSPASNLVDGDTNFTWDSFVHDLETHQTFRTSVSAFDIQGNTFSWGSTIAPDGKFAAFSSLAGNLVSGDTNNTWDIFVVEFTPPAPISATTPEPVGIVYSTDFETEVGPEWSHKTTDITPNEARSFLGQFLNDTVTLSLDRLPPHTELTISFELFIIQSWDGNSNPDIWELSVADGSTLLRTTFSNLDEYDWWQAFPDAYPGGENSPHAGAAEIDTLGFTYFGNSVYLLSFTFPHTESEVIFNFTGSGLESLQDESWGVDNVEVRINEQDAPIEDVMETAVPTDTAVSTRIPPSSTPSSTSINDNFAQAIMIDTLPFTFEFDTTEATTKVRTSAMLRQCSRFNTSPLVMSSSGFPN